MLAGPGRQRDRRVVAMQPGDQSSAEIRPQIQIAAEIAHRLDALGHGSFLSCLLPQVGHGFGVAPELQPGSGE